MQVARATISEISVMQAELDQFQAIAAGTSDMLSGPESTEFKLEMGNRETMEVLGAERTKAERPFKDNIATGF